MKRRIAIIGASENQNPLILRAKEMGFETHAFAWKTGDVGEHTAHFFYPISILKRTQILEKCREIKPDAVVSISSNDASATAAYIARELGQRANGAAAAENTINKINMRAVLGEAGLYQPKYTVVGDSFDVSELADIPFPLIVKPCDRSNCRGIGLATDAKTLSAAIAAARSVSFSGQAIAEEYIDGFEIFCECISFAGNHSVLCYSNVLTNGAPAFSVHEVSQPADFHGVRRARLDAAVNTALDAIGVEYGASHVKLMIKNGNIYVLRVSASMASDRIGTRLVPLVTGCDYLKMVIDAALGQKPESVRQNTGVFARLRYIKDENDACLAREVSHGALDELSDTYFITVEHSREMGGYLPLELRKTGEFFPEPVLRFNSARTAIWYAAKAANAKRVWLPLLYSPYVKRTFAQSGLCVLQYRMEENFRPADIQYEDGDIVVLVNYYGVTGRQVRACAAEYPQTIVDNSFAFFEPPVSGKGRYTVYSCRRFFGVADGAYLLGDAAEPGLERDISCERMAHLLKSVEYGSPNAARSENSANEAELGKRRLLMSNLTQSLMASIDYPYVKRRREDNYRELNAYLRDRQQLELPDECAAQCYPLECDGRARQTLNKFGIHIPTLWRSVITEENRGTFEYRMANDILALPIDQRYDRDDMKYLSRTVCGALDAL